MCMMKKEEIKKILMKLLDTPDVQQKIRNIIACDNTRNDQDDFQKKDSSASVIPVKPEDQTQSELTIAQLEAEIQKLKAENISLQNEIKQKNSDLNHKDSQIETAHNQNEELNKQLAETEQEKQNYVQKVKELKKTIDGSQKELQAVSSAVREKSNTIQDLNKKLAEKERINQDCTEKVKELKKELQTASDALKEKSDTIKLQIKKLAETEKRLNTLQTIIEPFQKIYAEYEKLPELIKHNMSGIFPGNTMWDFIFCGMREEILPALWDQWLNVQQRNPKACGSLEKIFMFFFERINRLHEEPDYELLVPEIGSDFDSEVASRDHSSNARGTIEQVLLPGFSYASNGRIIRKPRVHVK